MKLFKFLIFSKKYPLKTKRSLVVIQFYPPRNSKYSEEQKKNAKPERYFNSKEKYWKYMMGMQVNYR